MTRSSLGPGEKSQPLSVVRNGANEPIAITGIGCRFPGGADSPEAFWQLLRDGVDAITEVPADRWQLQTFYDPDQSKPGKMYTRWGGFLDEIDRFDALFFGISPREAARMDPQQRLLLELTWEALEDAWQVPQRLANTTTGVFIGISSHDYGDIQQKDRYGSDPYAISGGTASIAANRISYVFDFRGPSLAVDTACSSSLVAVHLACQSLWNGECTLALAGGVNLIITPEPTLGFCRAAMLSPDGRCKAFDARADGYVRSEGAGVIVLKPLSKAVEDGDRIYAVIRGTGVNQDGRTIGMTVPSRPAQESLLWDVYRQAGVAPSQINYVEAHGTGTAVGDPIEANALGTVLSDQRPTGSDCLIGSVKSNIGHLEAASGIAGLIKIALAIRHREIPASLHFEEPNPEIRWDDFQMRVPRTLEPWPDGPAFAGVNSFGFGGSNAHVVLQEASQVSTADHRGGERSQGRAHLLPVSARTPEALKEFAGSYSKLLTSEESEPLHDVCYTASLHRPHHDYRLALVFHSPDELAEQVDAFLSGEARPGISSGRQTPGDRPKVAFVCSGMGPQWWAMGRQLLEQEPVFRKTIERCDELLREVASWSLLEELGADESSSRIAEAEISQPANFALQVALANLWRSWGIQPDVIVGHSAGEVAAAHLSGALSLQDAVRVIYHRSWLQHRTTGKGKMAAVGLSLEEAKQVLDGYEGRLSIGAINSYNSVTVSGDTDALEEVVRSLQERQVFCRILSVDVPYHSHHMDSLQTELMEQLRPLDPQPASTPIVSTVTADFADGTEFGASYWWRNVREPVFFGEAVDRLIEDGCTFFIELSPHPVLAGSISQTIARRGTKATVLPSLRQQEEERATMLASLGALFTGGYPIDWSKLYPDGGSRVRLPSYPWQRERHWHELEALAQDRLGYYVHPLLGRRLQTAHPSWEVELDRQRLTYLNDHGVQGATLYPAAAYIEMALAAAKETHTEGTYALEDVEFHRALFLLDGNAPTLQLSVDPSEASFDIYSRAGDTARSWTLHCSGRLGQHRVGGASRRVALDQIKDRCTTQISGEDCYVRFGDRGLRYGPYFQGVERLWQGDDEALGQVRIPEPLETEAHAYQVHPSILDSCFQVLMGAVTSDSANGDKAGMYLPVKVDRIRIYDRPGHRLWSHARVLERNGNTAVGEVVLLDEDGNVLVEVQGLRSQYIENLQGTPSGDLDDCLYEFQWFPRSLPGRETARSPADYLPPVAGIAQQVRSELAQMSEAPELERYYDGLKPRIDSLCAAYIVEAFERMGWKLHLHQQVSVSSLMGRLNVDPENKRLLGRLLGILGEDGILTQAAESEWEASRIPEGVDTKDALRALVDEYPEFSAELDLLERCGPRLAEVLWGDADPLDLVFPGGTLTLAERFYGNSPTYRIYNLMVQRALSLALGDLPEGRTVRILEIGAGSGGLTAHVLPKVPANRTEYVLTDVSNTFTTGAERKFADYPFVDYRLLDIEADLASQGFADHTFDVILASDVLHATRDLRDTVRNVKRLLAPEGLLVLLELQNTPRWVELVAGLLKGWWLFDDPELRPSHPWISQKKWRDVLEDVGFSDIAAVSDTDDEEASVHTVILARGPTAEQAPRTLEPAANPSEIQGGWLIFADRGDTGQGLADLLEARGEDAILVRPGESFDAVDEHHFQICARQGADMRRLLEELASKNRHVCNVVHLWSLDAPPSESATIAQLEEAQALGCVSAMNLVQALAEASGSDASRLWLVTRGSQAITAKPGEVAVAQSPLWGLGRVIINEHPDLKCEMVDLDPAEPNFGYRRLFEELWSDDREEEVAYRGDVRYVNRLVRVSPEAFPEAEPKKVASADGQPFHLEITKPGTLDSLTLRETIREGPGPGEVEIQVYAAGLNFMDVMAASGVLPIERTSPHMNSMLGQECAGRIVAVGEEVADLSVGDEVVALYPGSFRAYVTVPAIYVVPKPAHLSFEEAATIPIVFMTTYYALYQLGRLSAGERVLIHSAAGGVGLAAVQLAQLAGAEIFATAGNPAKRAFLSSLGVEHVMDSRSLDFADEVMERTDGKGVDMVLNSLAGEAIAKSLLVLGPYGRFLEIGKRDIYENRKLGLEPFRRNLSFFAIDLARIVVERPDFAGALLREVMQHFADKRFRPIPHTTFPISKSVDAFRYMAQAKHTGKIVITIRGQDAIIAPSSNGRSAIRSDGTYLITGGLGGFGLTVAQWMVDRGAEHLALVGRGGASSEQAVEAVESMRRAGAEVEVIKADVSNAEQVAGLIAQISRSMPPLRGVVHTAMILDDGLLLQLDADRLKTVMAPKMNGAWNLHTQTLDSQLDFFVLFSSFASLVGNPGQGNYVAANMFLDTLAHYRRSKNLPALTINWGVLADVGYIARHDDISRYLETIGFEAFTPKQAVAMLEQFIQLGVCQVGAVRLDWQKSPTVWPQVTGSPRFSHLLRKKPQDQQRNESSFRAGFLDSPPEERKRAMEDFLREQIAKVLRTSPSKLDFEQPLANLGLDSLMVVELTTLIDVEVGSLIEVNGANLNRLASGVPADLGFRLTEDTTMAQLATNILAQLSAAQPVGTASHD